MSRRTVRDASRAAAYRWWLLWAGVAAVLAVWGAVGCEAIR